MLIGKLQAHFQPKVSRGGLTAGGLNLPPENIAGYEKKRNPDKRGF
jgi:hypothetical protein